MFTGSRLHAITARLRHVGIRAGLETVGLVPAALQRGPWSGRGIVFTLHHVRPPRTDAFQPNANLSITPEFLDSAIRVALECGLAPVRLEEVPALLAQSGARRFFAFTLDDGYRDNAEHAAPVFRRYRVPYTIFATSGFVDRSSAPWWEVAERLLQRAAQVRFDFGDGARDHATRTLSQKAAFFARLARHVDRSDEAAAIVRIAAAAREGGIDPAVLAAELVMDAAELRELVLTDGLATIGAHTVTHRNLARLDPHVLGDEIEGSMSAVESLVGRRPQGFAYPYGWRKAAGKREARAVAGAGAALAVTTRPGVLRGASANELHLLPRVSLNGLYQEPRYVRALISGLPFLFR